MTQNPESSRTFTDNALAVSLAGFPLSLEQIEERTIKSASGDAQTHIRQSKIYRDAAGRIRIERAFSDPSGQRITVVQIQDPIAGFAAVLTPDMIAHRVTTPQMQPSSRGGIAFFGTSVGMPGKNAKHEKLERRTIEGIDCDGLRVTGGSDYQPIVEERWVSTELGLVALIEASSPDEHYSARVLKVTRTEPDPELFVIPKDYQIRDLGDLSKD